MTKHAIVHSPDDYEIVEKIGRRYDLHIFESREQFTEWRRRNPRLMVTARKAQKVRRAVDHRGEIIF